MYGPMQVVYATVDCGGEVRSQRYASILRAECLPPWGSLKIGAVNMLRVGRKLVGKSGLRWLMVRPQLVHDATKEGDPRPPCSWSARVRTMLSNVRNYGWGVSCCYPRLPVPSLRRTYRYHAATDSAHVIMSYCTSAWCLLAGDCLLPTVGGPVYPHFHSC